MTKQRRSSKQNGGTVLGVVVGLIVGLVIAVVVALYITRSPSPFVSKTAPATVVTPNGSIGATDPNRVLQGKSPGLPAPMNTAPGQSTDQSAAAGGAHEPQIIEVPPGTGTAAVPAPATRLPGAPELAAPQPAASVARAPRAASVAEASAARATGASAAAAKTPPPASTANANTGYVLQAGAYKTRTDAEQQRARLALQGFESKITERDNGGVTYYRVRVGPFTRLEDVNTVKQRLSDAGVETAIIRFQKQ